MHAERKLSAGAPQADFPDELSVEVDRDDQRYGWFVSRSAFGSDLYLDGRNTNLRTRRGLLLTAQAHLEHCWTAARANLVGEIDDDELELVDSVVFAKAPLPGPTASTGEQRRPPLDASFAETQSSARSFGFAVGTHSRPGYDLAPVMLTWDRAVFVLSSPYHRRLAFANVPAPLLESFVSQLTCGALDETVLAYLSLAPRRRRLDRSVTAARPGLYDLVAPRARLLEPERMPQVRSRPQRRLVSGAAGRGRVGIAELAGRRG